jgi:hypothetical protein
VPAVPQLKGKRSAVSRRSGVRLYTSVAKNTGRTSILTYVRAPFALNQAPTRRFADTPKRSPKALGLCARINEAGRREEIFRDDRDRSKFLGYLSEGAESYKVKVQCYVLMENHFHLVRV